MRLLYLSPPRLVTHVVDDKTSALTGNWVLAPRRERLPNFAMLLFRRHLHSTTGSVDLVSNAMLGLGQPVPSFCRTFCDGGTVYLSTLRLHASVRRFVAPGRALILSL